MGKKRNNARRNFTDYTEDDKGWNAIMHQHVMADWRRKFDPHQLRFADAIGKSRVVFVDAPAGTGKTLITVLRAIEMLRDGIVQNIKYVRFPDKRGQKLGALPGGPEEKESGYMKPFYENAMKCGMSLEDIQEHIRNESIELSTDIHFRGRTFDDSFIILDEAQNGNIEDLQLTFTRIADSGYCAAIGHSKQVDNKVKHFGSYDWNAFQVYQYHMNKKPFTSIMELQHNYRGDISRWADKVHETIKELDVQQRKVTERVLA